MDMIAPLPGQQGQLRSIEASPALEQRVIENEMALFQQAAARGN